MEWTVPSHDSFVISQNGSITTHQRRRGYYERHNTESGQKRGLRRKL